MNDNGTAYHPGSMWIVVDYDGTVVATGGVTTSTSTAWPDPTELFEAMTKDRYKPPGRAVNRITFKPVTKRVRALAPRTVGHRPRCLVGMLSLRPSVPPIRARAAGSPSWARRKRSLL